MQNIHFAFSMHKSGSSLFFGLLEDICNESIRLGLKKHKSYLSIPGILFKQGLGDKQLADSNLPSKFGFTIDDPNVIYGGFRFVPAFFHGEIKENAIISGLVRDPRDALTSHYFSMLKSHIVPPGKAGEEMLKKREELENIGINEFIANQIDSKFWLFRQQRIVDLAKRDGTKFWRYEDVIFNKKDWIEDILDRVGIELPNESKINILKKRDILPSIENVNLHIRKVTPGDHKEKLSVTTIEKLNEHFFPILSYWQYDIESSPRISIP